MSAAGGRVPRSAWFAAGAAAAAGVVALGAGVGPPMCAGLLLVAAGRSGWARITAAHRVGLVAAGVGAVLLALRVLAGPGAAPIPSLADAGPGPWTATVEAMGSPRNGEQVARLRVHGGGGDLLVAATLPAFPAIAAAAEVEVLGRLRPPPEDDPYGEYLRRTGASGSLDATSVRILAPPPALSLQALRDGAGDALRLALPEPEAGLAAGILIGLRERVDRDLATDFATAGASHVVAISGWNIAIVAGIVGALMRGRPRRIVALVVGGTITAYVVAAGASPSVVRAALMAGVVLAARESGRSSRAPAALGLATAGLLLLDPALIGDAGFRLSVMATAGLLAWATPLGEWLGRLGGSRLPGWLAESLGISLAAQAATLPDVLATFGRLSLISPAVNLLVVPLVPVAMAGGLVAMVAGGIVMAGAPAAVGILAGLPGWLVLHLIVAIVRTAAGLPLAAVALPPELAVPAGIVAGVAVPAVVLLFGRWRRAPGGGRRSTLHAQPRPAPPKRADRPTPQRPAGFGPLERAAIASAALVLLLSSMALGTSVTRATRVVMLDIGQGDAILVESASGARMLVDGGPDPERLLIELDARIPPWDRRIDVVVLTHPHEDHVAGLARVLQRYRVGRAYEPGMRGPGPGWAAWDTALHEGPPRGTLAAGARIHLDEISLLVLWPRAGEVPRDPPDTGRGINGTSIVLLGEAQGRHFLLTGDAEEDVDPSLVGSGLPHLDLLKVAHHGSATATSADLLTATRPTFALISVGAGNEYGHPAPSTLDRLAAAGTRVYRTDRDGTIEATLTPDGVRVATTGGRTAAGGPRVSATGYDRPDDRTLSPGRRPSPDLARSTRVVPAPRLRRGRRGGVAGVARSRQRARGEHGAGCRGGPAP